MSSMLLTFHVNDIVCQNLNLPHLLSLLEKPFFIYEKLHILHMVHKHGSNFMESHGSIDLQFS
jgi:hypothetical protein